MQKATNVAANVQGTHMADDGKCKEKHVCILWFLKKTVQTYMHCTFFLSLFVLVSDCLPLNLFIKPFFFYSQTFYTYTSTLVYKAHKTGKETTFNLTQLVE
ncbi:hypothetical protein CHARACLAT_003703 [Characodon lateralis]|uniref:Uncharacterized protein n=1 Tax=Characodon lateralis TaxID=208331 RepID=A0ABU7DZ54_9TELE|nr:hypothetical protein [Characodon lateralis]